MTAKKWVSRKTRRGYVSQKDYTCRTWLRNGTVVNFSCYVISPARFALRTRILWIKRIRICLSRVESTCCENYAKRLVNRINVNTRIIDISSKRIILESRMPCLYVIKRNVSNKWLSLSLSLFTCLFPFLFLSLYTLSSPLNVRAAIKWSMLTMWRSLHALVLIVTPRLAHNVSCTLMYF